MSDSTEQEPTLPRTHERVRVGAVREIGDGLRMGVVRAWKEGRAQVQVWPIADQTRAEFAGLRVGDPVTVLGRTIQLTETGHDGTRAWITVVCT